MKATIALVASLLVFVLALAWNFIVADFMGNFTGPDDLPAPGFRRVFFDAALRASPVYAAAIIGAVASALAISRNRREKRNREPQLRPDNS